MRELFTMHKCNAGRKTDFPACVSLFEEKRSDADRVSRDFYATKNLHKVFPVAKCF